MNYGITKVLYIGAYHVVSGSVNWGQSHWHLRVVKSSRDVFVFFQQFLGPRADLLVLFQPLHHGL